ncbi:hypothetical protein [Allocoleopsis franciscana]|uniref:Uncharacterized protein n=1 Tax=Allocoleopsis franciscana PCC 7113 TaxID=1173027 RepID=K9WHR4_9CYAN|nr:hypothetical protein [Allocoleopsis franciscana]AFZ19950.1 hypothetical protein Mic7113_4251 [Allocoleopsis franciscana PCC 7113]
MPSDSPGRYQSRFFNFLNRQSVRLSSRVDRAVRQIKVAATWGVQILLYPAYLLTQVSLSAGRQLSSEAEAGWPKLKEITHKEPEHQETPPEADTPIQRVLREVTTLPFPEISGSVVLQPDLWLEDNSQVSDGQTVDNGQLTTPSRLEFAPPQTGSEQTIAQTRTNEVRHEIQGVASLLETRSLVLVTIENQILDILTPQQQQKLASKMSWEVANLWRQRRLVQASKLKNAAPRLSSLDQPRVLLPVRLFWKVMAWVQTSPVAIAANLFQESTLIGEDTLDSSQILPTRLARKPRRQLPGLNNPAIANQRVPPKALASLDRTIAELESHQLVPGTEGLVQLRDSLQDRWNSSLANVSESILTLRDRSQKLSKQEQPQSITPEDETSATETSQTHSFQIQALIYAAIEYFFGRRGSDLSGTDAQERTRLSGNPQRESRPLSGRNSPSLSPAQRRANSEFPDTDESDPWLSWGDLFGQPESSDSISQNTNISQGVESRIPNPKSQSQLPEGFNSQMPIKPRNSVWDNLKRFLSPKSALGNRSAPGRKRPTVEPDASVPQAGKLTAAQKTPPLATPTQDKGSTPTKQPKTPSSVDVTSRRPKGVSPIKGKSTSITNPSTPAQDTGIEPSPDWIETKATPTGYVKHPLERLLGWLDRSMLWLEEFALKVWRWLRRLGR